MPPTNIGHDTVCWLLGQQFPTGRLQDGSSIHAVNATRVAACLHAREVVISYSGTHADEIVPILAAAIGTHFFKGPCSPLKAKAT